MGYNKDLPGSEILNAEVQTFGALAKYGLFRAVHTLRYDLQRPVVRWRFDRHVTFEQARHTMHRFRGNPDSGNLPPQYQKLAVLTFDQETIDEYAETEGGRLAVRYRLGKMALMQGTSAELLFGVDYRNNTNYAVAMGIGKGDLWVEPGVRKPGGHFLPVPYMEISSRVVNRADLPAGATLL